jgi:GNAT superfamily N-acetyltransferase
MTTLRACYQQDEGWAVASVAGQDVGMLRWDYATYDDSVSPTVIDVSVDEPWRRQGIGTALFTFARRHESGLVHSDVLTNDGMAFVAAVRARYP